MISSCKCLDPVVVKQEAQYMVDALPGSMKDPFRDCEVGAEPSCNVIANKNFENYRKKCILKWNTACKLFRPGAPPPNKNSEEWKLQKVWNTEYSHIRKKLPSVDQPLYPTSVSIDVQPHSPDVFTIGEVSFLESY